MSIFKMGKQTESDTESEPLTPVSEDKDASQFVYCVNEGYLPSHIRTVVIVPSEINSQDNYKDLKHKSGLCQRQKCLVIIISLVVTLIISTVVSLALWKYFDQQLQMDHLSEWTNNHYKEHRNSSHNSETDMSNTNENHSKVTDHILPIKSRTSCNKICFSYSAFRFKSKCVNGFCVCRGLGYNPLSCMPQVNGCLMKKSDNNFAASKYNNQKQNTFSCSSDTISSEEVHVISNFGNNYSNKTIIDISDVRKDNRKPVVLVLINYQKVKWMINIKEKDTNVKKVYLISNKNLSSSTVTVVNGSAILKTEVVKYYSQTGYGDDRYGGHTVEILQKIYKDIGSVTTFTGTSCADHWTLTLKTRYSLDT